jgi:Kef-type K+ transport system membrane component KefB
VDPELGRGLRAPLVAAYAAMIGAAAALFLLIRRYGETLAAPAPAPALDPAAAATASTPDTLLHVLVALTAVIVVGRIFGSVLTRIGQPPVIGEVIAGIALGPSLLGRVAPEVAAYVLPAGVAPYLGVVAQLGVMLYMFVVGLELNTGRLRNRAHATVAISHASIVVPFVLGSLLALFLYPRLATSDVPFTNFALFMGVAMSITAFPVLARILTDRGMTSSELGVIALTCAAADDVTAWCLLALVVGVAQAELRNALLVVALAAVFIAVMFAVVRPLAAGIAARPALRAPGRDAIALTLGCMLLSALATEWIGIHAIFGAFLFGVVIPHDSPLARTLVERLETLVVILLLPAFFALTGMQTQITLVSGVAEWLICGMVIAVATIGKFAGSVAAARFTGMDWRTAASLGILMNTRGLMALIVLNIGLNMGIISPTLFAMMVIMAVVTTVATTPILDLIGNGGAEGTGTEITEETGSRRATEPRSRTE